MKFLEKDLETIIYESGRDLLEERGLLIEGKLLRQVKIGNYGIADLISVTKPTYDWHKWKREIFIPGYITIFELKKENIGISALLQSIGYAKGIQSYLQRRNKDYLFRINICLIGKEIDKSGNFIYLPDLINNEYFTLEYLTYEFRLDGLHFINQNGYILNNEGF